MLAIRNGHVDVVRELLTAGAIVPPPGLTADPNMLALLYPPQMYGLPHPSFNGGMAMGGPEFYNAPGNAFYPQQQQQGGHPEHYAPFARKESPNGAAAPANLPPAEVSKTIPCRNFPNCKYGAGCVFFHPAQSAGPGFYPGPGGPMRNGFVPNGFEGGYPQPGYPNGHYYVPNGFNSFPPPPPVEAAAQAPPAPVSGETAENGAPAPEVAASSSPVEAAPIPVSQAPSAIAPVFVPQFAPPHIGSPPAPSQFGLSPLSPSMLAGSLPSIPPAEAFFAQSPPNGFAHAGPFNPRRQSFGQPFNGGPKPFHSKKPSFSNGGAPRPFRGSQSGPNPNLGQWKDGNPPPCAFFAQSKCRNGEYCKFPHIDAEGNDVRHPDVVRGVIPPLPSLGRQGRGMRMSVPNGFAYDQGFRPNHAAFAPQVNGHGSAQAPAIPEGESDEAAAPAPAVVADDETAEKTERSGEADKPALPASVPAKPAAPMPSITRSASQPGVQRVHANGFTSRSHSPAPSNVSFHGNGHPRRGGARVPYVNGQRSSSQGETKTPQRVPGADEFPALGGATSPVLNGVEKKDGKTAAQVLSAPAPYRPKAAVPETAAAAATAEDANADAQSVKSDASVSMEDESDSDAVIISHKASPAPTPSAAATAAAATRSAVSFASVISAAAASAAPEPTAVGVSA